MAKTKIENVNINTEEGLSLVKDYLSEVSSSFCLAKWLQVTIDLENGVTQSCHHPPRHRIPENELEKNPSVLHNTMEKKVQRKLMLNNLRPPGCNYCWRVEDSSETTFSDRVTKSAASWALPYYDEVVKAGAVENIAPRYLEVMFSKKCNLSCTYCAPEISSGVEIEARKFGPVHLLDQDARKATNKSLRDDGEVNPYEVAFWKWFPEIYEKLINFRITGGEPLLEESTFRSLQYVVDHPNPKLTLAFNSNLCVPKARIDRAIELTSQIYQRKAVKEVQIFASVDTYGSQAEYIRPGLDYQLFISNIERFLSEIPGSTITLMCTFSLMSVPGFEKLLKEVVRIKHKFPAKEGTRLLLDIAYLRDPNYLNLKTLDQKYYQPLYEAYEFMKANLLEGDNGGSFLYSEINKMKFLIDWALKEADSVSNKEHRQKNFKIFVDEMDRRKGRSFCETFPSLKSFYEGL
tara:strand:+ start:5287 stop:6672 length:1386 start_codon:yes stop_codon:yes gene_type:complete